VAALDLRANRANQGAIYDMNGSESPSVAYRDATTQKMRSVLYAAWKGSHDAVVLGALGCGAFKNPPEVIAGLWMNLLKPGGEFHGYFEVVLFAVPFCAKNFHAFNKEVAPDGAFGDGSTKPCEAGDFAGWLFDILKSK